MGTRRNLKIHKQGDQTRPAAGDYTTATLTRIPQLRSKDSPRHVIILTFKQGEHKKNGSEDKNVSETTREADLGMQRYSNGDNM